jgi:hypothetical protein
MKTDLRPAIWVQAFERPEDNQDTQDKKPGTSEGADGCPIATDVRSSESLSNGRIPAPVSQPIAAKTARMKISSIDKW